MHFTFFFSFSIDYEWNIPFLKYFLEKTLEAFFFSLDSLETWKKNLKKIAYQDKLKYPKLVSDQEHEQPTNFKDVTPWLTIKKDKNEPFLIRIPVFLTKSQT